MHTDLGDTVMAAWEPASVPLGSEDDDIPPWAPGDGFPDGNDSLRRGLDSHDSDDEDDEAPSPSWDDFPLPDSHLAL